MLVVECYNKTIGTAIYTMSKFRFRNTVYLRYTASNLAKGAIRALLSDKCFPEME